MAEAMRKTIDAFAKGKEEKAKEAAEEAKNATKKVGGGPRLLHTQSPTSLTKLPPRRRPLEGS